LLISHWCAMKSTFCKSSPRNTTPRPSNCLRS
jgi:hypothetical protein